MRSNATLIPFFVWNNTLCLNTKTIIFYRSVEKLLAKNLVIHEVTGNLCCFKQIRWNLLNIKHAKKCVWQMYSNKICAAKTANKKQENSVVNWNLSIICYKTVVDPFSKVYHIHNPLPLCHLTMWLPILHQTRYSYEWDYNKVLQ